MKSETGFVISVEFVQDFHLQQPAFSKYGMYTYEKQLTWLNDLENSFFSKKKNTTFKVV
jgi:hypothetical protein